MKTFLFLVLDSASLLFTACLHKKHKHDVDRLEFSKKKSSLFGPCDYIIPSHMFPWSWKRGSWNVKNVKMNYVSVFVSNLLISLLPCLVRLMLYNHGHGRKIKKKRREGEEKQFIIIISIPITSARSHSIATTFDNSHFFFNSFDLSIKNLQFSVITAFGAEGS